MTIRPFGETIKTRNWPMCHIIHSRTQGLLKKIGMLYLEQIRKAEMAIPSLYSRFVFRERFKPETRQCVILLT